MPSDNPPNLSEKHTGNFIHAIVSADVAANKNSGRVITRFPPEPNGYLHIGHAKSICLNFGIASEFHGRCNLRFDDTNPEKENLEYIESIKRDVQWLGFEWAELRYASGYFDALYEHAVKLIEMGKAYVDSQDSDKIRLSRGTLTSPGRNSPYRDRSPAENLDLFERMRAGEFADGSHVLRAKIDMASPNINLRDPVIYRIRHARHHQTEDRWCLYPMYDYAHCLSDAFEGITHSLCTLEFEDHRPLYDWILDTLKTPCHPQQIEFARLSLEYTVLSKRKLQQLVEEGHVDSWDDPRMPTLSGLRRRGYTPAALREFCSRIGITKKDSLIEINALETALREDLDTKAPRAMAVLNPLCVVIHSYPEDKTEILSAPNHPQRPELGQRDLPFSRVLYIEQDDFLEEPPKKFFRLSPGAEVRLRHAYIIKCEHVIKDADGKIVELHCTHDPETLGRNPTDRKVKGVIHWVSAAHALDAEVRLYDRLFTQSNPAAADNFLQTLNPNSLQILKTCKLESSLVNARPGEAYQFERQGYFCLDSNLHDKPVYNLTVTLRDSWAKMQSASQK